jgi:hypothetical protein
MSSVEELESQWLQARFAEDYRTRKPKYETDARYRAEVDRMQFELETARANAARPAAPSAPNPADVELLNRAMRVGGGKTYFQDAKFRERIEALRTQVHSGGSIPANVRAATEADLAARGVE